MTTRRTRSLGGRLGEIALNVAALGGLLAIVLVALALFFNVSMVMFKTGSMAPAIPAGALAVVREIPASEVRPGDVVTVDRPGELPITHRVMTMSRLEADGTRSITLRGDANELEDVSPYTVSSVRIVVVSVPGLAHIVAWISQPLVLGSVTLGATALVLWAFWPRSGTTTTPAVETSGLPRPREHRGSEAGTGVAS